MAKKSIVDMNERERRHHSLSARTLRNSLFQAIILGLVVLAIGLMLFTRTMTNRYIADASSLARSAAGVMEQYADVRQLTSAITDRYHAMSSEERSQTGTEAYYARFADLTEREDYKQILATLGTFLKSFGLDDIYLATFDTENSTMIYIVDPDESEHAVTPGEWEEVSSSGIEKFLNWSETNQVYEIADTAEYGWLCTSGAPIYTADGEVAAYVFVDISMNDLKRGMRTFILGYIVILSLATALIGIIASRHSQRTVAQPIATIAEAAQQYVKDRQNGAEVYDHFSHLDIHSGDEVENLSLVMADMEQSMAKYMDNLTRVTAEKERITTELSLATRIQESMLPHIFPPFPDRRDFDIYATMDPAKEVGGDFYDFFLIDDDHLCMVIADVSGKGVPAALFMMASKIIIQSNALPGRSAAEILTHTNDTICQQNAQEMFVTVWLGVLDLVTGRINAANAGHEYPVLMGEDGQFALYKDKHGFVIGGMEGMRYRDYELQLNPGDKLFLYTDGVAEATNAQDEQFGLDRMIGALNLDPDEGLENIIRNVRAEVDRFVGDAPQFDDLTMLCLEYRGRQSDGKEVDFK